MTAQSEHRALKRYTKNKPWLTIGQALTFLRSKKLKILKRQIEAAELKVHRSYLKEVLQVKGI